MEMPHGANIGTTEMTKSAARATEATIHKFVGNKVRELKGSMPIDDFAAKSNMRRSVLVDMMEGEPSCLARLESLATRHGKEVGWFFPDGTIPKEYPEH